MKRFDTFGAYMFDLLFAPLKKGRRTANQFAIFFRVIGREFDSLKDAVFRVRAESNVASASVVMLPIHGQDRNMPRLAGETDEGYRTRLSMKGIIASWAGTVKGIQYAMASLGYEHSSVQPVFLHDAERWAEFIVWLGPANSEAVKELHTVYTEIQNIKEASSRLAYFVVPHEPADMHLFFGVQVSSYTELVLNDADSIILVRDRAFRSPAFFAPGISSYKEEVFL